MSRILHTGSTAITLSLILASPGLAQSSTWSARFNLPRTYEARPTTAAITQADLKSRLYPFADDSMGGRLLGEEGNFKGVEYIAAEIRKMGLEPAGDSGTFFQAIPVFMRVFDSTSTLALPGEPLKPWIDFIPRDQGGAARSFSNAPVIYGGTWGDSASLISREAAAGKVVVLSVIPAGYNQGSPGGVPRSVVTNRFRDAAGIVVASMSAMSAEDIASYNQGFGGMRDEHPQPLPAFIYVTERVASSMLMTPLANARAGQGGRPLAGSMRFKEQPLPFPSRNVVGIIRGSDPTLGNEFVAIGAHNDHIGTGGTPVAHDSMYVVNHLYRKSGADDPPVQLTPEQAREVNTRLAAIRRATGGRSARPDSIYNGADDDGSGSVGVLEIAQYFAAQRVKPKRSLLFVWHVGEEAGLYGSQYFTDHPTVSRDAIVAQLNIDMIGRGNSDDVAGQKKEGGIVMGNPNYVQIIGSRRLSTELGNLAVTVNRSQGQPLSFDYTLDANGHPQNIYCRSDHYEYARYGIPIIFFTTGGHADYHQVTDETQYINFSRLQRISQFVANLATRVANLDHRVVVDQPKPDPHGGCQQ
jgi:hypothetical protein